MQSAESDLLVYYEMLCEKGRQPSPTQYHFILDCAHPNPLLMLMHITSTKYQYLDYEHIALFRKPMCEYKYHI